MVAYRLGWIVWTCGTLLVVLSWVRVVSNGVGWVGFVACFVGVALSAVPHLQAARTHGRGGPAIGGEDRANPQAERPKE